MEEHSGAIDPLRYIANGRRYQRALEVGVGCYGLGFLGVHFFNQIENLDAVDPLPRLELRLNDPLLQSYVDGIQSRVRYREARGEALIADNATYDLVAAVNVVDHAKNPSAIVAEIDRVLKPGGHFLFGVNTLSWAGEIKWKLNCWRHPDAWLFRAHPHTFQWRTADALVRTLKGRVQWNNAPSIMDMIVGHGRMSFWIVEKET